MSGAVLHTAGHSVHRFPVILLCLPPVSSWDVWGHRGPPPRPDFSVSFRDQSWVVRLAGRGLLLLEPPPWHETDGNIT